MPALINISTFGAEGDAMPMAAGGLLDSMSICDGKAEGFPLRYVNQGFLDLFGHSAADCLGKSCGALVGADAIIAGDPELLGLATEAPGLEATAASERLNFLTRYASEQMRKMAASPESHAGFALLLNRKKNGDIFVCELTTQMRRHPTLGWLYAVGVQRDVSADVPVAALLQAALPEAYLPLLECRAGSKALTLERLESPDLVAQTHESAYDMWQAQMSDLSGLLDGHKLGKSSLHSSGGRSSCSKGSSKSKASCRSVSTTASGASGASGSSRAYSWVSLQAGCSPSDDERFLDLLDDIENAEDGFEGDQDLTGVLDVITELVEGKEEQGEQTDEDDMTEGYSSAAATEDLERSTQVIDAGQHVHHANVLGADLQSVVDVFGGDEFDRFPQALFLANALQEGCPIMACNGAFSDFTGYSAREAFGRPCFFMTDAVPLDLLDDEVSMTFNSFCSAASHGTRYVGQQIEGAGKRTILSGEMARVMTAADKSGELSRVILYVKQVELDDQPVIVGLLAKVPEDDQTESKQAESDCSDAFAWTRGISDASEAQSRLAPSGLKAGMAKLERLLAAHYWYSAPMRRQDAV